MTISMITDTIINMMTNTAISTKRMRNVIETLPTINLNLLNLAAIYTKSNKSNQ